MHTITIANWKGGVGKTTSAVHLAAALGLAGATVLLIDLDSQGNATEWLGVPLSQVAAPRSSYAVLTERVPIVDTVVRTGEAGVLLCPAHPYLGKVDQALGSEVDSVYMLSNALEQFATHIQQRPEAVSIEYIVVDCPGEKGPTVFNALLSADLIIAPVFAEVLSLEGLGELFETVDRMRQRMRPDLATPMVLIDNFDGRSAADRQIVADLRQRLDAQVWETVIRRDAPLRECFAVHESIFRYRPEARSAAQFRALADEIKEWFHATS